MCSGSYKTRRSHSQAENENGSQTPSVICCNAIGIDQKQFYFTYDFISRFFALWATHEAEATGRHLKLKKPAQLQEILDISRQLLAEVEAGTADPELEDKRAKLEQLKSVLEMYGHFSGINRKVQLKYQPRGRPHSSNTEEGKIPYLI